MRQETTNKIEQNSHLTKRSGHLSPKSQKQKQLNVHVHILLQLRMINS